MKGYRLIPRPSVPHTTMKGGSHRGDLGGGGGGESRDMWKGREPALFPQDTWPTFLTSVNSL